MSLTLTKKKIIHVQTEDGRQTEKWLWKQKITTNHYWIVIRDSLLVTSETELGKYKNGKQEK